MEEILQDIDFSDNISKQILDLLPFGISIHTKECIILFENKKMIEFFGSHIGKLCYKRWSYLQGYKDRICDSCPGHITVNDGKQHRIFRKTKTKTMDDLYYEITILPIIDQDGEFKRFMEIVQDVTHEEKSRLITLDYHEKPIENRRFGIVNFGDLGGEIVATEQLEIINDLQASQFFMKMAAFWFAGIGQGHQWPIGLYGPLPVLDFFDYNSLAYSFSLKSDTIKDKRSKGKDLLLLIIIIHRDNTYIFDKRDVIIPHLTNFFSNYNFIKELNSDALLELRNDLLPFLKKLNDNSN